MILIADLQRQRIACGTERDAALAPEAATAEVLQIIDSPSGNLTPVFDAMLEKRRCGHVRAAIGLMSIYRVRRMRPS